MSMTLPPGSILGEPGEIISLTRYPAADAQLTKAYTRVEHGKLEQVRGYAVHAHLGVPDMSEEEHDALREYGFSDYAKINSALRRGKMPQGMTHEAGAYDKPWSLAESVRRLDAIFARAKPTTRPLVVYRGGAHDPGTSYISTTTDREKARQWGPVHEIVVPPGSKAISMSLAGREDWHGENTIGEAEVLLDRKHGGTEVQLSGTPGLTDRSGMISVDLAPGTIPKTPGGVDEDHHITIVYLGKDVDDPAFREACRRAAILASQTPGPVVAAASGVDSFPASDGKKPAIMPVGSPGLHKLRAALEDLSASEHKDYKPHITLAYIGEGDPLPEPPPPLSLSFTHLSVHHGKEVTRFPFGGQFTQSDPLASLAREILGDIVALSMLEPGALGGPGMGQAVVPKGVYERPGDTISGHAICRPGDTMSGHMLSARPGDSISGHAYHRFPSHGLPAGGPPGGAGPVQPAPGAADPEQPAVPPVPDLGKAGRAGGAGRVGKGRGKPRR